MCPVDLTFTSLQGCKIHIEGTANCATHNNFSGTVTFSGPQPPCVNGNFVFRTSGPSGTGTIVIGFVGGLNFCSATALTYSGGTSDARALLDEVSADILAGMKVAVGC